MPEVIVTNIARTVTVAVSNVNYPLVTEADAEAGVSTQPFSWSPDLINAAIQALAPAGTGDVVGPASATDGALVAFDGTTGKLIKACTTLPAQFAADSAASPTAGTFTVVSTVSPNLSGLTIRTGNYSAYTYIDIGRTASEANFGIAAGNGQFFSEGVAGDFAIKNTGSGRVLIGTSSALAMIVGVNGEIELRNTASLGTVTGGARIGAIGGYQCLLNADGGAGKIAYLVSAPATASSTGFIGQIAYDATHFYVCIATDTWVRGDLAAW